MPLTHQETHNQGARLFYLTDMFFPRDGNNMLQKYEKKGSPLSIALTQRHEVMFAMGVTPEGQTVGLHIRGFQLYFFLQFHLPSNNQRMESVLNDVT